MMIGAGRQHRVRSPSPAIHTKRTRLRYKIWHGEIRVEYERAAAGFRPPRDTALVSGFL